MVKILPVLLEKVPSPCLVSPCCYLSNKIGFTSFGLHLQKLRGFWFWCSAFSVLAGTSGRRPVVPLFNDRHYRAPPEFYTKWFYLRVALPGPPGSSVRTALPGSARYYRARKFWQVTVIFRGDLYKGSSSLLVLKLFPSTFFPLSLSHHC